MREDRTVVIITGRLPFQKYFCVEMFRRQNVVAILHPGHGAKPTESGLERLQKKVKEKGILRVAADQIVARPYIAASRKYGTVPHFLHRLGRTNRSKYLGWNREKATLQADQEYFADASTDFARELSHLSETVDDINSQEGSARLSELNPDAVICLGGPIYRPSLISSCRLMLNWHTGISPIYNGTGTIYWTFAQEHIHLSGATLMVMGEKIDGGDILAHYFPTIEANDDPARLFAKCVVGAVSTYDDFLNWFWSKETFARVPQCEPFFYFRGFHWNITQNMSIERILKSGAVERFKRDAAVYEYWKEESDAIAKEKLKDRLAKYVFRG